MTDLTQAQKEAYARAHSSTVHLWALEFRHPTFAAHIRIVNHRDDITLTLQAGSPVDAGTPQLFVGTGMRVKEPKISREVDATLSMQIDGVPGTMQAQVANANKTNIPIDVTIRPFSYEVVGKTVGQLLGLFNMQVKSMSFTKTTISVTMGYTNSANQPFPSINYTATSNPGLI